METLTIRYFFLSLLKLIKYCLVMFQFERKYIDNWLPDTRDEILYV